jgi:hypothetical protein
MYNDEGLVLVRSSWNSRKYIYSHFFVFLRQVLWEEDGNVFVVPGPQFSETTALRVRILDNFMALSNLCSFQKRLSGKPNPNLVRTPVNRSTVRCIRARILQCDAVLYTENY